MYRVYLSSPLLFLSPCSPDALTFQLRGPLPITPEDPGPSLPPHIDSVRVHEKSPRAGKEERKETAEYTATQYSVRTSPHFLLPHNTVGMGGKGTQYGRASSTGTTFLVCVCIWWQIGLLFSLLSFLSFHALRVCASLLARLCGAVGVEISHSFLSLSLTHIHTYQVTSTLWLCLLVQQPYGYGVGRG